AHVGREGAQVGAALKANVVQLETWALLLVPQRSVPTSVFLDRDLANVAAERLASRIELQIARVRPLEVVRAIELRRRNRRWTAGDIARADEPAHDPRAPVHVVLEVHTAEGRP